MKKKIWVLLTAIFAGCVAFGVASCDIKLKSRELTKLELDTVNAETEYLEGETFSDQGLWILAHYSDSTTTEVKSGYHIVSPEMYLTEEELARGEDVVTREVLVAYHKVEATYEIKLAALKGIVLDTEGVKTDYAQGESLDTDGLGVFELYGDGTRVPIAADDVTIDAPDLNEFGAAQVTVHYEKWGRQFEASYQVIIEDPDVMGIEIDKDAAGPAKHFYVGDRFSYDGLKVNLVMTNGERTALNAGYTVRVEGAYLDEDGRFVLAGEQVTVTVAYGRMTAQYQIDVEAVKLTSITLDSAHVNKDFFAGDELTHENLTVTAHYNNGDEKTLEEGTYTVTADHLDGAGKLTADSAVVTVSYKENDITMSATYAIKVEPAVLQSLSVDAEKAAKEFDVGDEFTAEGIVVVAHFNNGDKTLNAGDYTVSDDVTAEAGVREVTISYLGETASYTVDVYNKLTALLVSDSVEHYYAGMTFDRNTLTVKAVYNEDAENAQPVADYTLDGVESGAQLEARTYSVTVAYTASGDHNRGNATASLAFEVEAVKATGLALDGSALEGRTFYRGDEPDLTGLKITLSFNFGDPEHFVVGTDDEAIGLRFAVETREEGDFLTVSVSLRADGAVSSELKLPLTEKVTLDALTVTAEKSDLLFETDAPFTHTGVKVMAKYSNSDDSVDITAEEGVSFAEPDLTSAGEKTVTVSFGGQEASYTVYVIPSHPVDAVEAENRTESAARLLIYVEAWHASEATPDSRENRSSESWLLFDLGENYRLVQLSVSLNGWTTVFPESFDTAPDLTVRHGNRDGAYGDYLEIALGGESFWLSETDWHWALLGWEITSLTVQYTSTPDFVTGNVDLASKISVLGNYTLGGADATVPASYRIGGLDQSIGAHEATVTLTHGTGELKKEITATAVYGVIPDVGDWGEHRLVLTAPEGFKGEFSLLLAEKPAMLYGDADASAQGWIWLREEVFGGGYRYTIVEFTYNYTAEGALHEFVADGFTFAFGDAGVLEVTCQDKTFTADSAVWQQFVCGWRGIESVDVNVGEAVTVFEKGALFTSEGVTITVHYAGGDSETLNEHFTVTAPDMTASAEAAEVKVTFRGFETHYTVLIHELQGLVVENNVVAFKVGEEFRLGEGVVVKAHYDFGEDVELPYNADGTNGYRYDLQEGALDEGGKLVKGDWTVTISYKKKTHEYSVNVAEEVTRTLDRITASGAKSRFDASEPFSSEGLVVTAHFSTGDTEPVEAGDGTSGYTLDSSKFVEGTPGTYEITVRYQGQETTYEVTVVQLTGLELDLSGFNPLVKTGETFSADALKVRAKYANGTEGGETVDLIADDYAVSAPDMTVAGEQTVTVTYRTVSEEFTLYVLPGKLYQNYTGEDNFEYIIKPAETFDNGFANNSADAAYQGATLTLYMTDILNGMKGMSTYSYGWLLFDFGDRSYRLLPFEVYHHNTEAGYKTEFPITIPGLDISLDPWKNLCVKYEENYSFAVRDAVDSTGIWQKIVLDWIDDGGLGVDSSKTNRTYHVGDDLHLDNLTFYSVSNRRTGDWFNPNESFPATWRLYAPDGTEVGSPYKLEQVGVYTVVFSRESYNGAVNKNTTANTSFNILVFPAGFDQNAEDKSGANRVTFTDSDADGELSLYVTERSTDGAGTTVKGFYLVEMAIAEDVLNRRYEMYEFEYRFDSASGTWTYNAPGVIESIGGETFTATLYGVTCTAQKGWKTVLLGN